MTVKAKNKKHFSELIKEYRNKGYNLITYSEKLAELENENEVITITR